VLTRYEWEEITDFNEKCPEIPALTLPLNHAGIGPQRNRELL